MLQLTRPDGKSVYLDPKAIICIQEEEANVAADPKAKPDIKTFTGVHLTRLSAHVIESVEDVLNKKLQMEQWLAATMNWAETNLPVGPEDETTQEPDSTPRAV